MLELDVAGASARCPWVNSDPLYLAYHDREWGVPDFKDRSLFEKLILDGAQAGLRWYVILKKREGYRRAFDRFDAEKMARYDARKVAALMRDADIVRNRLKIDAAIVNARAYLALRAERDSFSDYIWGFVDGRPRSNQWRRIEDVPSTTAESDAMSKDLKRRGFKFVGSTICYAFMQAVGMVNDHVTSCFRHKQIESRAGPSPPRPVSQ